MCNNKTSALELEQEKYLSLYELAKKKSWNTSTDMPWGESAEKPLYPLNPDTNPLAGYIEYEILEQKEKAICSWFSFGLDLSDIHFGEQAALMIAAQLVEYAPSIPAKLFLSSQVYDEARHVEFFSRYISQYIGSIHPPSNTLNAITKTALSSTCWIEKYLYCHALIESLALAKFQTIRDHSQHPLLRLAMDYILKDEARHVHFGIDMLRKGVSRKTHMPSLIF